MKNIAIATVAGFAAAAAAQSVASYTIEASSNPALPGSVVTFSVTGQADAGQVGNGSGINGVNLSIEIAGGTLDFASLAGNAEQFGATNSALDAEGFDISMQSNSFAGNNFSAGLVLFSFDVVADQAGPIVVTTSQGTISTFNAATGLPGAFTPSVAYDVVNFGSITVPVVPAPGAAAVLGLGGLAVARRRRA